MVEDPPEFRRAARLLVLDPDNRVLLFKYEDDGRAWWVAPGGGLEGDETFEAAAVREAAEELAIAQPVLRSLWSQRVKFRFRGRSIHQVEQYFLMRLTPHDLSLGEIVREAHRVEGIVATRWWSAEEIEATHEQVFPVGLVERLRTIQEPGM